MWHQGSIHFEFFRAVGRLAHLIGGRAAPNGVVIGGDPLDQYQILCVCGSSVFSASIGDSAALSDPRFLSPQVRRRKHGSRG